MANSDVFRFGIPSREIPRLLPDISELHRAEDEAMAREARIQIVPVLTMQNGNASRLPDSLSLTMPGTVTLFLGWRGSALLDNVRRAALGDDDSTRILIERLREQFSTRDRVSLGEAVDQLIAQPVFAELQFDERTVARNLFVPDEELLTVITLPYTGGDVDPTEFRLIEYTSSGVKGGLEGVILKNDPPLTPAERAAIAVSTRSGHPGTIPVADPCDADFVEVVLMVLLYVALAAEAPVTHIPDERIAQIGPEATVRELLQIRREAIKIR